MNVNSGLQDIIALFTVHEADGADLAGDVDKNDPLLEI